MRATAWTTGCGMEDCEKDPRITQTRETCIILLIKNLWVHIKIYMCVLNWSWFICIYCEHIWNWMLHELQNIKPRNETIDLKDAKKNVAEILYWYYYNKTKDGNLGTRHVINLFQLVFNAVKPENKNMQLEIQGMSTFIAVIYQNIEPLSGVITFLSQSIFPFNSWLFLSQVMIPDSPSNIVFLIFVQMCT